MMKPFKRVVTRRGVTVLFSDDFEKRMNVLLKYRSSFVQKNNPYLFRQKNSKELIYGCKLLQKYSKDCAARAFMQFLLIS